MKKSKESSPKREIRNSKVRHNFFIGERFEAGLQLQGTEVKSIRAGRAQISESFVRIDVDNVPTLYHAHIDEYIHGNENNHVPTRPRRLLLHKREIARLRHALEAGGQSLIPLRIYFKRGIAKIEIALCQGKKLYDKREDIKKRVQMREAERAIAARRR